MKVRRGQSSRTRDKEDLQPDDRGTPSHKYAIYACFDQRPIRLPQSNSENVSSHRLRGTHGAKKSGPDCSEPDPYRRAGYIRPRRHPRFHFTSLKAGSTRAISARSRAVPRPSGTGRRVNPARCLLWRALRTQLRHPARSERCQIAAASSYWSPYRRESRLHRRNCAAQVVATTRCSNLLSE